MLLKGADTLVASPGRGVLVCELGDPGLGDRRHRRRPDGHRAAFLAKGMDAARLRRQRPRREGSPRTPPSATEPQGLIARDVVEALSQGGLARNGSGLNRPDHSY